MDLHHSIAKAFSLTAFFGLTLAPQDGARGIRAVAGGLAPTPLSTSASAPAASVRASTTPAASDPVASVASVASVCGEGMLLIEGEHCLDAEQVCVKWLDPPPYQNLRCAEYEKPAKCKRLRVQRRFCIDRHEFAEPAPPETADVLLVDRLPAGF